MRRGQAGDCMYFIAKGEVQVQTEPSVRLGPGAFFGEMALITGATRAATVVTTVPTTLLRLHIADFRALAETRPELMSAIHDEAARRSGRR